jgi:voltage-gated potassium channel
MVQRAPEAPGEPRPRLQHNLRQRAEGRALAHRRIFPFLAGATALSAIAAGVLVWIIDRRDFHTLGDGLWWALVTIATVGYGDIVPHTAWGRIVGSVVIVVGVTFIAVLTATLTSIFISTDQDQRADTAAAARADGSDDDTTQALLRELVRRLESIERRLEH